MWTCPKCGRTFKRQEQSHYCGKAPETVDEYIAGQPKEVQEYLKEIRKALCAALPEAANRVTHNSKRQPVIHIPTNPNF